MTAAERGLLLLCTRLGDEDAHPLSMAEFRTLSMRGAALGMRDRDPDDDVRASDLIELGYSQADAERITGLLNREALLDRYLLRLAEQGVQMLTRISDLYPARVSQQLRRSAPPVLYYAGNPMLLALRSVSVVGSRSLTADGQRAANRIGTLAGEEDYVLCSGGAAGADSAAERACLAAGGSAVLYLAGNFFDHLGRSADQVASGRLLLLSESEPWLPFHTMWAHNRNRLIHTHSPCTVVCQSRYGEGGTWSGTMENLRNQWSDVFVHADGSDGARALIEHGGTGFRAESLTHLSELTPRQCSLFSGERFGAIDESCQKHSGEMSEIGTDTD